MKPALKSRCRLVIPDVDKRKEEVHLDHLLLLPSIEQLLENRQQKEPERSQRGVGNRVTVSEQRILVKSVATVQLVERTDLPRIAHGAGLRNRKPLPLGLFANTRLLGGGFIE